MTGGIKLNNDWEIGTRFRFSGGSPYTPYNDTISSLINVWDVNSFGVFDYNQLNGKRLKSNMVLILELIKNGIGKKLL